MLKQLIFNPDRIFGLDLMRAVAILLVLIAHGGWIFGETGSGAHQLLALMGYLGVEIFFVLSGFLIGRILFRLYTSGDFSAASVMFFLKRRWFRTLPAYYLVLILNILLAYLIGYQISDLWRYFFFLQNFNAPLLAFFPESWSLSVEEFAYLFLPLMLVFIGKIFSFYSPKILFLLSCLSLMAFAFAAKVHYHQHFGFHSMDYWNIAVKSVVIFRLDAILMGVLCSWIYSTNLRLWDQSRSLGLLVAFAGFGFMTVGLSLWQITPERFPLFWNVFYLPMTSLSIAGLLPALSRWVRAPRLVLVPVTFISLISYSLYLLHYSLVLQGLKYLVDTDAASPMVGYGLVALYFVLTFGFGYLLFRYFEKPMTDLRERQASTAKITTGLAK
jgi:peptidoglycan/LPS O-acetylase OafA/YrhL